MQIKVEPLAIFIIIASLLIETGCASQPRSRLLSPKDSYQEFLNGNAMLDCGIGCLSAWSNANKQIRSLYANDKWQELATSVLAIGYRSEESYFYLGRAAEGIGQPQAANNYYRLSLDNAIKCHTWAGNICDGLDLPKKTKERLAGFDTTKIKINKFLISPPNVKAGNSIKIETDYSLWPKHSTQTASVTEKLTLKKDGQVLITQPEKVLTRTSGTYLIESSIPIPKQAKAGSYTLEAKVQAEQSQDIVELEFLVNR